MATHALLTAERPIRRKRSSNPNSFVAMLRSFRSSKSKKSEVGNPAGVNARSFVMRTRSDDTTPFSLFQVAPSGIDASRTAFAGYIAVPARAPGSLDVPAYPNMARVSGSRVTPESFATAGLTTAAKLDGAARSFGGKPLSEFKSLLDWGGGVGRVARHIRDRFAPKTELWCVDVDRVNVEEAKDFVKNSICKTIPYYPPTDLPSEHFDLYYGDLSLYSPVGVRAGGLASGALACIAKRSIAGHVGQHRVCRASSLCERS